MGHKTAVAVVLAAVALTFGLGAKRRSVRAAPCTPPTLTLSVTPQAACPGETVTVNWRASDFTSIVHIECVGTNLRWTGSSRIFDASASSATATGGRAPLLRRNALAVVHQLQRSPRLLQPSRRRVRLRAQRTRVA